MRLPTSWLTNLSLDAPIVGTLWLALFGQVYRVPVPAILLWLLFSSIWLIYVVDRLVEWDYALMRERHTFHQRYRRFFIPIVGSVILMDGFLVWQHRFLREFYEGAAFVAAGAAFYLGFSYLTKDSQVKEWVKNILVSIIFSMGCTLPVWTMLIRESRMSLSFLLEFASLALLVFCNLRFIEADEARSARFPKEVAIAAFLIIASTAIVCNRLTLVWLLSLLLMMSVRLSRLDRISRTAYDIALIIPAAIMLIL